jgi:Spy/CpxP family protein refolding chaperone
MLGLVLAGGALAQQTSSPESAASEKGAPSRAHAPNAQQQLQRMTKQLQLSSDQQAKLGPILQQRDQQVQALRSDSSLKPADRRAKMMGLMQDTNAQVDAVLTPAQRDQLKAMREKAMERAEERRAQHAPASSRSSG